jgi:hypothetical protein
MRYPHTPLSRRTNLWRAAIVASALASTGLSACAIDDPRSASSATAQRSDASPDAPEWHVIPLPY